MPKNPLLEKRLSRILKSVALEKPDRTPVVLQYSGFAAYVTNTPMAEYLSTPLKATETMIRAYELVGDGDAVNYGSFSPYVLCYLFGAKVKVPGLELGNNEMWQVLETEIMKLEDYDRILDMGWRSAPSMLSAAMWDRFVWPYFKRLVNEVIDAGLIALLHLDSNWDRELARFRELPKGRCIMATDGETDLFKAKEILGDHMCLMGDVPATMQCLGSPDEVYEYSTRLIRELGPEGFILQSGCDIAANAKLENVRAMVGAATGK